MYQGYRRRTCKTSSAWLASYGYDTWIQPAIDLYPGSWTTGTLSLFVVHTNNVGRACTSFKVNTVVCDEAPFSINCKHLSL
eukprot:m.182530 g.182530  ORF g.182530 m.182530 type:complete len:81 (+) comp32119_c9_seq1:157-399(+)